MYEFTPLFVYKSIFMAELLLIEFLFTFKLHKHSHYPLKLLGVCVACLAVSFLFPLPSQMYNAWYVSLMFFLFFACSCALLKLCYEESWFKIVFLCVAAYSVQHFAHALSDFLSLMFGLTDNPVGIYGSTDFDDFLGVAQIVVYFICYYVIYWLSYVIFGHRVKAGNDTVMLKSILFLAAVIMGINIILNSVFIYNVSGTLERTVYLIIYIYSMATSALALFLQFLINNAVTIKTEFDVAQTLWAQKSKQYELSKNNIELINIKCHDLKHQTSVLNGKLDPDEIKQIVESIKIYDTMIETGNEVLNVILTEKSLYCNSHNIRLDCVIDGQRLNFVSNADLYSLFGNAIDNAIEAVVNIEDKEKRMIGIMVKGNDSFVNIHLENYFTGNLYFVNNSPLTSKSDKNNHGYGIKSMRMIAKKYHGRVDVTTDDNIFYLDILLTKSA